MAKSKKSIWALAVIIILALIVSQSGFKFSFFTPQTQKSFQWLIGSGIEASDWWVNDGNHDDIAIIGDYKFIMQKTDRFDKAIGCKTSSDCGGGADTGRKDANNCPIYSQTVPVYSQRCVHSTCRVTSGCLNQCDGYLSSRNYGDAWNYLESYQSGTTTQDCSGLAGAVDTQACGYNVKIYKSGALIQTIPELGTYTSDSSVYFDRPDISAQFNSQNGYHYARCDYILNWITPKFPANQIELQVSAPKTQYFQGENASVDVIVTNSGSEMTGNLNVKYEIPTGLLNPSTQLDTQFVTIKSGINKFTYSIPTKGATSKILITPSIELFMPLSGMSGVNYGGSGNSAGLPVQSVTSIPVGMAVEKTFEVAISVVSYEDYQGALNQADTLNKSLQEKLALIEQLGKTLEEKGIILNQMQLSVDAQAQLISNLTQKANEQGIIINQLQLNVNEKAALIAQLTKNIEDQSILIFELQNKEKEQAQIINNMQASLAEKAAIITQLTDENDKQGEIIANLNLNLQQKAEIIKQLDITTAEQAELIKAMKISFADQQALVDSLGLKVTESQALILALQGSVAEQMALSEKYKAERNYYATQLIALQGNVDAQVQIIKSLNLKVSEQADLISKLQLTVSQDAELIKKLNLNIQEQATIIAGLKLSNEQDKQLVAKLTADLAEQQRLLDAIKAEKEKTTVPTWVYLALAGGVVAIVGLMLKKKRR